MFPLIIWFSSNSRVNIKAEVTVSVLVAKAVTAVIYLSDGGFKDGIMTKLYQ